MSEELIVEGDKEVLAMFDAMPRLLVVEGYLDALQAGAAVIVEELEPRVPIRLVESGGELLVEGGDLKGAIVTAITLDVSAQGGTADVGFGKQGYKARFVEYGHHMVGHKPGKKDLGTVSPHPFMRPAADAAYERSVAVVAASIEKTVQKNYPQQEL